MRAVSRFDRAGGGRKTGGRMEHAGKNKCDHNDQRVSLWMCSVTTLTILVRAWDGMTLACASICKAGRGWGSGTEVRRRGWEALLARVRSHLLSAARLGDKWPRGCAVSLQGARAGAVASASPRVRRRRRREGGAKVRFDISLWMCSVTTLTILVRAWDGMILACASICKAGGDGEAGQRRDGEAGRLAGKNAVSPAECCALGG